MIKLAPDNLYDVPAQQAWLEDQAATGWFLTSAGGPFWLARFQRGEPKTVRYRLEPAGVREASPDAEQRALYRRLGWEYVDTAGKSLHIWRCDDPAAPELHTEPETESRAYDRLYRDQRILDRVCVGLLLFLVGLEVYSMVLPGQSLMQFVQNWMPLWRVASRWCFFGVSILMAARQSAALRRYLRKLRAGVPGAHRRPYRLARVINGGFLVATAVYIAALAAEILDSNAINFEPLDTFDEPVPYVALTEPEQVEAIRWNNWQTLDQWWTLETEGALFCESRYYRLWLPGQSGRLVDSILAGNPQWSEKGESRPVPGLDEAWVLETGGGDCDLVLRRGDQVWEISCQNSDPTAHLGDYAAVLAAFQ